MLFVQVDDLKPGMRLGKPIYNRNGVLLYDRDSRLTMQAIYSIRNFGLMGLYILEPAEPVPPMSEEDINFERFQTIAVFSIREDFELLSDGKKDKTVDWLCSLIIKNYANHENKINYIQSLRSKEDFVYKHCLNVAILTAIIAGKLNLPAARINLLVKAALFHDIGAMTTEAEIENGEQSVEALELCSKNSLEILNNQKELDMDIERIVTAMQDLVIHEEDGEAAEASKANPGAAILYVADAYDRMTAMKSYEEPTSEVLAVRVLLQNPQLFDKKAVNALISGINILYPGVCVELSNKEKGLVVVENKENIFEPWVLCFTDNKLIDLSSSEVKEELWIADVMKTMDNRIKLDPDLLQQYEENMQE